VRREEGSRAAQVDVGGLRASDPPEPPSSPPSLPPARGRPVLLTRSHPLACHLPAALLPILSSMESSRGGPSVLAPALPSSAASGSAQPAVAAAPPVALSSVTSPSGYVFPPIWSFPPFFTPQPNAETHAHQTTLWTALLLSWARWHRVFELRAADDGDGVMAAAFENKAIRRRCGREYQRQLMQALVANGALTLYEGPAKRQRAASLIASLDACLPLPSPSQVKPCRSRRYLRATRRSRRPLYSYTGRRRKSGRPRFTTGCVASRASDRHGVRQTADCDVHHSRPQNQVSSTGQTSSILTFAELQSEDSGKSTSCASRELARTSGSRSLTLPACCASTGPPRLFPLAQSSTTCPCRCSGRRWRSSSSRARRRCSRSRPATTARRAKASSSREPRAGSEPICYRIPSVVTACVASCSLRTKLSVPVLCGLCTVSARALLLGSPGDDVRARAPRVRPHSPTMRPASGERASSISSSKCPPPAPTPGSPELPISPLY
jgi:hypothetical protein